jgi:signal transduction histidine kinase
MTAPTLAAASGASWSFADGLALGAIAAGVLVGVVAWVIARRVLRVREEAARLAEGRARSAERMAEIGAMTSGLAHEIKNPLSTINLNAQLLGEAIEELPVAPDDKGRLTRRVGSLRRETERLQGILMDFLSYAGELRLDVREADLNALVGELVDFYLPQAEKQRVRLRADLSAEVRSGAVRVDVPQVKQAVLNLMLNAVQAMSGSAADRPRELILRTAAVRSKDGRDEVELHVIDTGPGIDSATRERLFKPYFTTKAGGTGLGLATTRRIIEAHGGRIELHSDVGRGTDFVIVLPAGARG